MYLYSLIIPAILLWTSQLDTSHQDSVDSLNILSITNDELIPILSGIIDNEKRCEYYSKNLLFTIRFQTKNSEIIVVIDSPGNRIIKIGDELGCFVYRNHLFFVSGESLDDTIFRSTVERKKISWYVPNEYHKEVDRKPILDIIEDDTFSLWVFKYRANNFTLIESRSNCK